MPNGRPPHGGHFDERRAVGKAKSSDGEWRGSFQLWSREDVQQLPPIVDAAGVTEALGEEGIGFKLAVGGPEGAALGAGEDGEFLQERRGDGEVELFADLAEDGEPGGNATVSTIDLR